MGTIPPNLMTTKQRTEEAASIMVLGIARLWRRREPSYCLDSNVISRMYAKDGNKEEKLYEKQCTRKGRAPAEHAAG